ncbi:hypothetical protein KM043_013490 [Ampulex compressa]|nr:hypothetical protein KM043_013490 [Ampulex compressa]
MDLNSSIFIQPLEDATFIYSPALLDLPQLASANNQAEVAEGKLKKPITAIAGPSRNGIRHYTIFPAPLKKKTWLFHYSQYAGIFMVIRTEREGERAANFLTYRQAI